MPVILTSKKQKTSKPSAKNAGPKYFCRELTGSGGQRGVLTKSVCSADFKTSWVWAGTIPEEKAAKQNMKYQTGEDRMRCVLPVWIIDRRARYSGCIPGRIHKSRVKIAEDADSEIYAAVLPAQLSLMITKDAASRKAEREAAVVWWAECLRIRKGDDPDALFPTHPTRFYDRKCAEHPEFTKADDDISAVSHCAVMLEDAAGLSGFASGSAEAAMRACLAGVPSNMSITLDFDEWKKGVSLYDMLCAQADEWVNHAGEAASEFIEQAQAVRWHSFSPISPMLSHLEDYDTGLDQYDIICRALDSVCTPDDSFGKTLSDYTGENLNLLLSVTLRRLEASKDQLEKIPDLDEAADPFFSDEQADAVTSTSPLTLVQSGAGTGKSTVVLGRLARMMKAGVDPADITVLSFTNAAADHIAESCEGVHSMTIAAMIHEIYKTNFPDQELSETGTLINALEIFCPRRPEKEAFADVLRASVSDPKTGVRELNRWVQNHLDTVQNMLDACAQTTLELEIILCYHLIDTMKEPDHVACRHLIIDEVQDNSVFEFIYLLKYAGKHKTSLFMVGDSSQTLYEFRASDPKALNVLESLNIFDAKRLQTNYRSNQEILDFANCMLEGIEANRYANIRLHANGLAKTTAASLSKCVRIDDLILPRACDFEAEFTAYVRSSACPLISFIEEGVKAGEQVCVIAHARRDVKTAERLISAHFPDAECTSLVPSRPVEISCFSSYLSCDWDGFAGICPTDRLLNTFRDDFRQKIASGGLVSRRAGRAGQAGAEEAFAEWLRLNYIGMAVLNAKAVSGAITRKDFLGKLKSSLMHFEIAWNAKRKNITQQMNRQKKETAKDSGADILFSTIHSVKGLEFDRVVILCKTGGEDTEEKKRMYYVALTRAMKKEFILNYGSGSLPQTAVFMDSLMTKLEESEKQQ